jgi:uncharacterized protein YbjT (DUF2867 family)
MRLQLNRRFFMSTKSPLPYLVFGVSGRTGAAAADALLRAGQAVRVAVRDAAAGQPWAARGAEVVVADLADLAAMTRACSGVAGAYVLSPQQYASEDLFEWADLLSDICARAVVAAGVPALVALSSVGADRHSETGWIAMNRAFEQCLGATGIPVLFLRAAYFMENWAALAGIAARSGTLPSFLAPAGRAIPMVATADVGRAAAALLMENPRHSGALTLSGPRDYAPVDVAAVIAACIDKPVEVAVLPEAAWAGALAQAGFSAAALAGFSAMTRSLNDGHISIDSDPAVLARTGTTGLSELIPGLLKQQP